MLNDDEKEEKSKSNQFEDSCSGAGGGCNNIGATDEPDAVSLYDPIYGLTSEGLDLANSFLLSNLTAGTKSNTLPAKRASFLMSAL